MPNWLEKILSKAKQAKAKISNAFKKIPLQNAELWKSCPECKKMFLAKQLKENLYVCTQCDYHFRIGAKERFKIFLIMKNLKLFRQKHYLKILINLKQN